MVAVSNPPGSASEKLAGTSTVSGRVRSGQNGDRAEWDACVKRRPKEVVPRVEMLVLVRDEFFCACFYLKSAKTVPLVSP